MSINDLDISGQTLDMSIKLTHLTTFHREVKALVDTGSLKSDFIAPDIAQKLIKNGATMRKVVGGHHCQVCTTDG